MPIVRISQYSVLVSDVEDGGRSERTPINPLAHFRRHHRRRFFLLVCVLTMALAAMARAGLNPFSMWTGDAAQDGVPKLTKFDLPKPGVLGIISDEELTAQSSSNSSTNTKTTTKSFVYDPNASRNATSLSLRQFCPRWSPAFADRFAERCGYWLRVVSEWDSRSFPEYRGSAVYTCANLQDETECHGLGDRLTGLLGVFIQAIETRRNFRVHFNGLHGLFAPCAFRSKQASWSDHPTNREFLGMRNEKCRPTKYDECHAVSNIDRCDKAASPLVYPDLNRACIPKTACKELIETFPDTLSTSDVFGCPMRAFMEPTQEFLSRQIRFYSEGMTRKMSIEEAETIMSRYRMIAIHVRMGDYFSFTKREKVNTNHHQLLVPLRCAATVESYLRGESSTNANSSDGILSESTSSSEEEDRREVRWLVASDSESYRDMAKRLYGDRVMMVDMPPIHIAEVERKEEKAGVLADTLAEWYLIGKADHLVLNRVSRDKPGKGILEGRISSFPKTAWAFNLKHEFYDAEGCMKESLPYDGGWRTGGASWKECWQSPLVSTEKWNFSNQAHLSPLRLRNLTFPKYWMDKGRVETVGGQ